MKFSPSQDYNKLKSTLYVLDIHMNIPDSKCIVLLNSLKHRVNCTCPSMADVPPPPPFGQFKNKFGDNKENRIPWISSGELRYLPLLLLLLLLLRLKRQCRELGWVQGARVVKDERR